jgi:hypothetical protein
MYIFKRFAFFIRFLYNLPPSQSTGLPNDVFTSFQIQIFGTFMVICYVFGYLVFLWRLGYSMVIWYIIPVWYYTMIYLATRLCRDQLELDNCRKSNGIFSEREVSRNAKKFSVLKALFI